MTCQRCFYFDRVIGLDEPGTPGWSLNETTDILLKKEFDICREQQTAHRLFLEYKLDHLVPFKHPNINKWRDALHNGLMYQFDNSNIILTGGTSELRGSIEIAKRILDTNIRLGTPIKIGGLSEDIGGPSFSACSGVLMHCLKQSKKEHETIKNKRNSINNFFKNIMGADF